MVQAGDDDEATVLGKTAPVGYVLMSGVLQQSTAAAHSAPNELLNSRQKMSSPLSQADRASTTTSISEARTKHSVYLSFL